MSKTPSEFRRGWPIVLAAATGVGLGMSGLLNYTAGIFAKDLEAAIGLSRTGLGAAFFLSTITAAIILPFVGSLIDRFGPRWPAVFGSLALSGGFLLLGTVVSSVAGYMAVMAGIGLLAASSSPVAHTRAVIAAFTRDRGLALGFTQLGIGVAGMVVPPTLAWVVATQSWQSGYLVLAGAALLGVLPALSLSTDAAPKPQGDSLGALEQMRSRTFILLLLAFGAMALSFAGLLPHFVPMLRESGMDARSAGTLAGLIGASVIVSRIIVGWLADRISAPLIAAASCLLCALGCLALAWQGSSLAWLGAIALGAAMGAEADLIGFLTARYFGMANYARLYAVQYASFMVMAGLGPLWIGMTADYYNGYTAALLCTTAGLVVATILFLQLPPTSRQN